MLFLCWKCVCFAQYDSLLHKTYAERLLPLKSFYEQIYFTKDSAGIFRKIDAIKKTAVAQNDDDLLLETTLMRANYFFTSLLSSERVLSVFDSLKKEGIKKKKVWVEALAENITALYYFKPLQQYELGFEHHLKVYELIKNVSPAVFPYKQDCLHQIANEYYMFDEFRESVFFNKEALKAEPEIVLHTPPMKLSILNTLGLCYQQLGITDSADYYFNECRKMAMQHKNLIWLGISEGNLGYNLYAQKHYPEAVPLLENDVKIAEGNFDWGLASGSLMVLASISLEEKNIAMANEQMQLAREYIYRSGQYQRLQKLYPLMSKLYAAQNQPELSATYLDSSLFVKDSLARKFNNLQALRAKQKVEMEQFRTELNNIKTRKKIEVLERNILIAVVILGMFAAVYIYRQQQKKYRLKQEQYKKAEEELAAASRQLDDFAKNISEKNQLLEILSQQSATGNSEMLQQLQQSTILTDKDWEYFRQLFEKVHAGFLQRLKEKLPGLTPAETRFMTLSKLRYSNKEMAAMLGIGTDAIRQYRSRLRKKLNLSEEGSLKEMVNSI